MAELQFLLGRSGSGKSWYIAREIASSLAENPVGRPVYWVVPGEQTYASERVLLAHVPATVRAEVVSVQRLAQRVLEEAGAVYQWVNDTGKRLLLASVYQEVCDELQVLRRDPPSITFLDEILSAFAEWVQYDVSADEIEAALETASAQVRSASGLAGVSGRSLIGKLRDLCLLYLRYRRALAERQLFDPAEMIALAAPLAAQSPVLQGAMVYVDGFVQLPPAQLRFLLAAAAAAERTVVSFPLDPAWLSREDMPSHAQQQDSGVQFTASSRFAAFSPSQRDSAGCENAGSTSELWFLWRREPLIARLERCPQPDEVFAPQALALFDLWSMGARALGIPADVVVLPVGTRRARADDLVHLERWLFTSVSPPARPTARNITLAAAQHVRAETEGVARAISGLVRQQAADYRDIAVLVPNLREYAACLRESFERYDIPIDMDDYPSFASYPLAKFVLACLQAAEDGMSLPSVLRVLKSEYCGLRREDADWLEQYLRRYEIDGVQPWSTETPWTFAQAEADVDESRRKQAEAEDARADTLRRTVAGYLLRFVRTAGASVLTPLQLAQAIWELIQAVGAKRQIAMSVVSEDGEHSPLEASMHEQAWQRLLTLLDDLALTLGDTPLPRAFLFETVRQDILAAPLTSIPAGMNHVLVTEYHRAAGWDAPYVFVLGAADGVLPPRVRPRGLLHDDERTQFAQLFGKTLGPTTEDRQLGERFTVYSVLTRARERLWVSYPLARLDGKQIRPSSVLQRIRELFADGSVCEELWWSAAQAQAEETAVHAGAWTPRTALDWLVTSLRSGLSDPHALAVAATVVAWHLHAPQRKQQLQAALRGFRHQTGALPLTAELARALYGNPLRLTVSRLESFAACPFQYFSAYGLRLQEPDSPEVTAARRGSLLHDALAAFVRRHMQDVDNWRALSDEAAVRSMQEVLAELLAQPGYLSWQRRAVRQAQVQEVLRTLAAAAVVLTRHMRYGRFRPVHLELSFGEAQDDLPAIEVGLGNGRAVALRGRIDRVDIAEEDGRVAFRVIDYKSRQHAIQFTKVEHGLQLQLPVYAAVVASFREQLFGRAAEPASILYLPVWRRVETAWVPVPGSEAQEDVYQQMRASGLLVDDPVLVRWHDRRLLDGSSTELFKKVYKSQGGLDSRADALAPDEWQLILRRAVSHVKQFARRILDGDIAISPYRWQQEQACKTCAYKSVCQLDRRYDSALFRRLTTFSKAQIGEWANIADEEARL